MPIDFSLIPQLRQTAPSWAQSLPPNTRPTTIEEAVSNPTRDIVEGFLRTQPQTRIARLRNTKEEAYFIQQELYLALFPLVLDSKFEPKDFEQLFKLDKYIESEGRKAKWRKLVTNISERLLSNEIREYGSHAKFIIVCNMLNDGWFSQEGKYLYRNEPSTRDALEEFNALSVSELQKESHYIVDGRPVTAYFIHSVRPMPEGLNAHNYSSIGYITCNLDQAFIESNLTLGIDMTPALGKVSSILITKYRSPVEFLFANTSNAILDDLCTIGTISQVEKCLGKQQIGLSGKFYEDFYESQLNNSKLKKICEYLLNQRTFQYKEAKAGLGFLLFKTAVALQKGALSQGPKIILKELLLKLSPFSPELLTPLFTIHLLADELREKININEDPFLSENFIKIDLGRSIEYVEKLVDLSDEALTSAFKNIAKRDFKNVLDSSDIVLVKN